MTRLIDKHALVAEIKRLIDCCYKICAGNLDFLQKSYPEHYYSIETYKEILSFIDTLEVKEVDLEKEIELVKGDYEQVDVAWNNDFDFIAKHFFELGLRAQKGEQNMKNITVSMIDIENALNKVAELISVVPQECKGESKESSICRRRWIEISKRINELV